MYIYIDEYEDDGMGPPLDRIDCPLCGKVHSSTQSYHGSRRGDAYRVLEAPKDCECGHTDSIVANSKAAFVEVLCDASVRDLHHDRKLAAQRARIKLQQRQVRHSVATQRTWSMPNIRRMPYYMAALPLVLLGILFALTASLSVIIVFVLLHVLLGMMIHNHLIQIYVSSVLALSSLDVLSVLMGEKLRIPFITWPVGVYRYLQLSQLLRLLLFMILTILQLADSPVIQSSSYWQAIHRAFYPAVVTSVLFSGLFRPLHIRFHKPRAAAQEDNFEAEVILNSIDQAYVDMLSYYLSNMSVVEVRRFSAELYSLLKRDFESYFVCNPRVPESQILVSSIVAWHRILHGQADAPVKQSSAAQG